jgi:hypothetical protein
LVQEEVITLVEGRVVTTLFEHENI